MSIAEKLNHFISAARRPKSHNPKSRDDDHNKNSNHGSHRCAFTFSDGRQCRMQRAQFCVHHATIRSGSSSRANSMSEGPLRSLEALCSDLTSATSINRTLTQVFLLMAQGRIPQKQAVAFGYLTQLLLQTVPGVRAEFVSAYGYASWEENLKASLESRGEADSNGNNAGPSDNKSQPPNDEIVDPKKEATAPAAAASLNKHHLTPEAIYEGLTPADFESLYARSLDLFDRKFDFTPEGQREKQILNYELELIKPPDTKPPKGHVGDVVKLARRFKQELNPDPAPAKRVARDFYGNPSPPADWWQSLPGAERCIPGNQQPFSQPTSTGPSALGGSAKPEERTISSNPLNASTHLAYVSPPPKSSVSVPPPVPDDKDRNRDTTAWFAPASWSGRPQPDPYPSASETLRTKFRSMANSAFRRIQHQNSRGYSSRGAKHLAT